MSLLDLQDLEAEFDNTEEAASSTLSTFHQCSVYHSNLSILLCP
jgi:hypothetical protein